MDTDNNHYSPLTGFCALFSGKISRPKNSGERELNGKKILNRVRERQKMRFLVFHGNKITVIEEKKIIPPG
jgi:hypothetical protein